jgi:hypothetical protein
MPIYFRKYGHLAAASCADHEGQVWAVHVDMHQGRLPTFAAMNANGRCAGCSQPLIDSRINPIFAKSQAMSRLPGSSPDPAPNRAASNDYRLLVFHAILKRPKPISLGF